MGLSLVFVPVAWPIVAAQELPHTPIIALNSVVGDSIGWPRYVQEIAAVYHNLSPSVRRSTIVLASNYGEAGAVNHFGPADGLPPVYSGHMSYWYWGPPPGTATTVIAVGFTRAQLVSIFGQVRLATHLKNHLHVVNAEEDQPVWVCSAMREPWKLIWPDLKNFA